MNKILLPFLIAILMSACGYDNEPIIRQIPLPVNRKIEKKTTMKDTNTATLDLPSTTKALVLRTDFSSDATWDKVCNMISLSGKNLGFSAAVEYINQKEFDNLKLEKLYPRNENYKCWYLFIVDSVTIGHEDHPILCVDLTTQEDNTFRLIPQEMWAVDNNLAISNMDFWEFQDEVDSEGIFRGV
ncbi:DUF6924 domain-containing protein [Lishizhenia sp.]|uniref:DUF6924 domain-containing protein n=1 Tax=Lishizhenia sp. TaxID=2497594 RepID=UPI00299E053F|nr:hypothetical protein [Lishizhenia sp.]MDX1446615.1 hypothetical protein [Lishizhenia sp.]